MKLTVDASVVVKWFVPEALSDEARILLGDGLVRYIGADHFADEIGAAGEPTGNDTSTLPAR